MGKTTCLLNLCKQMLDAGIRPIVFSYHQDIDEKLEHLVNSVRFIDFHGLGFNPLQVMDRKSRMAYLDVAGALRDIFVAIFPELGDIQGERIRGRSRIASLRRDGMTRTRFWRSCRSRSSGDSWRFLRGRSEAGPGAAHPARASGGTWRLRLLRSRRIPREPCGRASNPSSSASTRRRMTICRRPLRRLSSMASTRTCSAEASRDRITHAVVFDEAHRAADLRLIPTMAKECRKYGISLVLASQEAKDFNISLFSAIANYLVLRLTEADAKALVRNVASSDQERALIDRIKQMDRFKALYFCEGKKKPSPISLLPEE